jgi:carbamoyl-phosphate synthase/aspartate carbamoyltransferase/dihydroorotase
MTMQLPGLTDVHVHLRVPGGEHKEDILTGTKAAIAGGFTTILAMPNTSPPLTTRQTIDSLRSHIKQKALCEVYLFAGLSPDNTGALRTLIRDVVALKLYMNQTYGPLRIDSLATLLVCFKIWPRDKVIALHAEGTKVAVAIGLCAIYNQPVHICHVSRKEEIQLIAAAKSKGLPVTCEVTPHHLFLTEVDAKRLGSLGDMRPILASAEDVDALWTHIDTTIDCIATDHAPHTLSEKNSKKTAPPGVPGLDTALPLMLTAVSEGRLRMDRLVNLMDKNPRRIFNLPPQPGTWIEVDLDTSYTITNERLHTKCGWSPFSGFDVRGAIKRVYFRNHIVFQSGNFVSD